MQLRVKARNGAINDTVRAYAEKRLAKLERRLFSETVVEVTLSREHSPRRFARITGRRRSSTRGPNIVAREAAETYREAAIDRLVDKLERQIERYRDKRTHRPRRAAQRRRAPPPPANPRRGRPGRDGTAGRSRQPDAALQMSRDSSEHRRGRWSNGSSGAAGQALLPLRSRAGAPSDVGSIGIGGAIPWKGRPKGRCLHRPGERPPASTAAQSRYTRPRCTLTV